MSDETTNALRDVQTAQLNLTAGPIQLRLSARAEPARVRRDDERNRGLQFGRRLGGAAAAKRP